MGKNIIHKANIKPYNPVVWQGRPVWKFYAQLKNHLQLSLGAAYADLFSEPSISETAAEGQTDTIWLSDILTKKALKISALSSEERAKYETVLAERIYTLEQHANELLKGKDPKEKEWGELILKCIEIPSYDQVLVEGDAIVLVLWGFKERSNAEPFSLKRKIAAIAPPLTPITPINENESETPKEEEIIKENGEEKPEEEPKIQEVVNDDSVKIVPQSQGEEIQEEPKVVKISPWRNWKRWLWLLLLLLLLLFCVLGIKYCSDNRKILPDNPNVLIPIDSTKIKTDKDSTSKIVSDRLNVAVGAKDKSIQEFAEVFKKNYPSNNYKIIYYDSTTQRLQLQIPEEEREQLKKDLKSKMPEFKLLIWDEYLFDTGTKPTDPGFSDYSQSWHHERVKVYSAWEKSMGNADLIIAVIDDGFDLSHPELSKNVYKPKNLTNPKSPVNTGKTGHGTHVAGLALGLANNGFGVSGIAPNCKFMPLQVADRNGIMSSTAIIDAVLYSINNGADVINMSLGKMMMPQVALFPESKQEEMAANMFLDEEEFWNQLFNIATERGVTIVLAGGNQNIIIGLDPMQRTAYTINVSATDKNNSKASFSNYGRRSSLSAPGVQIFSALPNSKMGPMDGTSMAAPIVTGAVALMKSINPSFSNKEILEILQNTGIPVVSAQQVGNILQLDAALNIVDKIRERQPKVECPDAQEKIDQLLREIEKIKDECSSSATDTFKLPDKESKDLSFAKGRWRSTSPLFNVESGEKVTVYFDFANDGSGSITLMEDNGTKCSADLNFNFTGVNFNINQLNPARCMPPPEFYNPYRFECRADSKGNAVCSAKNKVNKLNYFEFNLVRVNTI